jgi:hypothetical protein
MSLCTVETRRGSLFSPSRDLRRTDIIRVAVKPPISPLPTCIPLELLLLKCAPEKKKVSEDHATMRKHKTEMW